MPSDKHVRRSGDDYSQALFRLLPQGMAWPRNSSSALAKVVKGLGQIFGDVDNSAANLLEIETDPRSADQMLEDWEFAWGLPDLCIPVPPTSKPDRRTVLVAKMTMLGEQSRAFFKAQAVILGQNVTIQEYAPYLAGYSRTGDTRGITDDNTYRWQCGPPEMRMHWTVTINNVLTGVECIFRRYKPAHTEVIFKYSGVVDRAASTYAYLGF